MAEKESKKAAEIKAEEEAEKKPEEILAGLAHWLEIDLDKLTANLRALRQHLNLRIIAVVKNDAYGFGAVECARALAGAGADMLAVTSLEEALQLREAGVAAPLLVFLPPQPANLALFAQYQLTATVDSLYTAELLRGWPQLAYHLKVNTGMNRFGLNVGEELAQALQILARPDMPRLTGVYSHLATALADDAAGQKFARLQIERFAQASEQASAAAWPDGFPPDVCFHLANSAGCLRYPEARFSAVRVGSALYGQLGLAKKMGLPLAEPFAAKARIAAVRQLAKGEGVGYSQEFTAPKPTRLAVIPYGYGDGFGVLPNARELTIKDSVQEMSRNIGRLVLGRCRRGVYYQGSFLPVLGRVAMQSMMVDIGELPLKPGDVVDVPLRRVASSARLPRVYLRDGKIAAVRVLVARTLDFGNASPKNA